MRGFLVKSLISCGGIVGAGCAVGIPLSSSSSKVESISELLKTEGGVENPCSFYDLGKSEGPAQGKIVGFDHLGVVINNQLTSKQSCRNLSFKQELKTIFTTAITDPNKFVGEVEDEEGTDCLDGNACGYLELKATKTIKPLSFKVRISKQSGKGILIVAKRFNNENGEISYYDGKSHDAKGNTGNEVVGSDLSSLKHSGSSVKGATAPAFSIEKAD